MLNLTIRISGKTTEDLIIAMEEVGRLVGETFTSGSEESEDSCFDFQVTKESY